MIVILFAIYTSLMTPFLIAFDPEWHDHILIILFDWVINIFFFADIAVNFRTTFIDRKTGLEIWAPKMIAKHYVINYKFWIDVASSIPFDGLMIESLNFLSAIGMLKLIRVSRISKIIQHLNIKKSSKTVLKVFQLLFILLLYIHLQA